MMCLPRGEPVCRWAWFSSRKDGLWPAPCLCASQVWRRPACLHQHHQRSRQPVFIQLFFPSVWRLARRTESHDSHPQHEAGGALPGESCCLKYVVPHPRQGHLVLELHVMRAPLQEAGFCQWKINFPDHSDPNIFSNDFLIVFSSVFL